MTRIETALSRMVCCNRLAPICDMHALELRMMLDEPEGKALTALVEAAEALRVADPFGDSACVDDRWWAAYARLVQDVDAFRAATEPAGGE